MMTPPIRMAFPCGHRSICFALAPLSILILLNIQTFSPSSPPPPREREETVTQEVYEWWLLSWQKPEEIVCRVYIDHPEQPTPTEIFANCGWDIYLTWISTPPCPEVNKEDGDISKCEGLYLFFAGIQVVTRKVKQKYPKPSVWLYLEDRCTPEFPYMRCPYPFGITLMGKEPFPEASISSVVVDVEGEEVECQGEFCTIEINDEVEGWVVDEETGERMVELTFWAESTWGDASPRYEASIRILPDGPTVRVNILSSQWREDGWDACSWFWGAFPPAQGKLPTWLFTPNAPAALATQARYYYLAGRLIEAGLVDASTCPNWGLQEPNLANECGLERALPLVYEWQNRFDEMIWAISRQVGIPAVLFKRLIAHESQFWPGTYFEKQEVGFGHLTFEALDTLLLWEPEVYWPLCRKVLGGWNCTPYPYLSAEKRQLLYHALWTQANLACNTCPQGIALKRSPESLYIFAYLLRATCHQLGQTIYNLTYKTPGDVAPYVDLWRFTIANYHNPNCVYQALASAYEESEGGLPLTWGNVKPYFPPACSLTVQYVEKIAP